MVFLCIACIVLSSIALHGIALHRIAWHCMVLQRLHGVVQIIWRAGELPRSASSHLVYFFSDTLMLLTCGKNGSKVLKPTTICSPIADQFKLDVFDLDWIFEGEVE